MFRFPLVPFLSALGGAVLGGCAVAATIGSTAIANTDAPQRMGHLVVERLDIVEPDGTLRQALYSRARDPGIVVRGESFPHPSRTQSGMLFYNDEGTEVGGLVYAGERLDDDTVTSGGALSFDAYEQDQIVQVIGIKEAGRQLSGVVVNDRPDAPMDFALLSSLADAEDESAMMEIVEAANIAEFRRGFFGREWDNSSTVTLHDSEGRKRLEMRVTEGGEAAITFFDDEGGIVKSITP